MAGLTELVGWLVGRLVCDRRTMRPKRRTPKVAQSRQRKKDAVSLQNFFSGHSEL